MAWLFLIDFITHRAANRDHLILHFQVNASLIDIDRFSANHTDTVVYNVSNFVLIFFHLDNLSFLLLSPAAPALREVILRLHADDDVHASEC
jgi:hypothetical protein